MDPVESVVISAIAAKTKRQPALTEDLARMSIDSLAMAEVALEIEEKLKVRLDEGILDQRTVGDLVEHVQTLLKKKQQPSPK